MGDIGGLFKYEKGRREDTSKVRPDPLTEESNELRFGQLQEILGAIGGLGALYGPETDRLFQLDPQARGALDRAVGVAQTPGLTPEEWRTQTLAATDPKAVIERSKDYLSDIITPQLEQQYSLMGLGRSGAMGEAVARAGTELALPIAQTAQAQRFAVEQQLPNVDVALRQAEIARQFAGFQAADIPRQLEVANWQRKAQGLGSAFNLVPYVAGQDSKSVSIEYGNALADLIEFAKQVGNMAMGAAMGGMGMMGGMMGGGGTPQSGTDLTPYTPPALATPQVPITPSVPYPQPSLYSPYGGGFGP